MERGPEGLGTGPHQLLTSGSPPIGCKKTESVRISVDNYPVR
jgi:hypothetical protein